MAGKVTEDELKGLVEDPEVSERELRPHFALDPAHSAPFRPAVLPCLFANLPFDYRPHWGTELLNWYCRRKRHHRYDQKLKAGYDGIRIVSEGDSWFQYPILLEDVIDQLSNDYAIYSLDGAAHGLSDIIEQDEIVPAIRQERPRAFMISAGGNDMLGEGSLKDKLRGFDEALAPDGYPNDRFERSMTDIVETYERLFRDLSARFPGVLLIVHGYDYGLPSPTGKWLGKPMGSLGIHDPDLQRAIVRVMMDRFNEELQRLAQKIDGLEFVDCRRAVDDRLRFDELHPDDTGFGIVADRFRRVLDALA